MFIQGGPGTVLAVTRVTRAPGVSAALVMAATTAMAD